ncbi:MAG TPA: NPCBM/NEW2 domain-containing protein [Verrucomicrobiae bacterium]|nr:NPCBM/NEW2 domain-containing protein [Verrucomicrobiae bacterium]
MVAWWVGVCQIAAQNSAGPTGIFPEDPDGRAMLQEAQKIIAAYHEGQPKGNHTLRVVYFVPKGGEPLANYAERVDRIVTDVSQFYQEGLERFGITNSGLPLERKDGKLVIYMVKGKLPASSYSYDSGGVTGQEIRNALGGKIDFEREHVLVFYALCDKTNDGAYVFHAPYYGDGGSSQRSGFCHVADCELLDPMLLTDTNHQIVFTEHYYPHVKQSVAKFNSLYLGGVAHELGHGLGLPHDNGGPTEQSLGLSLMGLGNLNYRAYLWGGKSSSYLSRGSALQIISHPLITGSDRGRWDAVDSRFKSLEFSTTNGTLVIDGTITGEIPAYGVIAYVWQDDDHFAETFPCVVRDGVFHLTLKKPHPGAKRDWHLKVARLHVNGATAANDFSLHYDLSYIPDVAALNAEWQVGQAERAIMQHQADAKDFLSDAAVAAAYTPEAARELRSLREVLNPPAPFDLATMTGDSAFVSDAIWTKAKVGWGHVARNHYWFDENIQNGILLLLNGKFYDKGLYAHSDARYVFPVKGKWKTFTAKIGLRDGANAQGSAIFTVRGDGRELFRSKILRAGQQAEVNVDIAKVKELELLTEGGEGHNHSSWAIWVDAKVGR